MGEVRFSCPADLVGSLATAGGIDGAIETGTFRAQGTLILREAVSRVWTVELDPTLHEQAVARHGGHAGITFLQGSSDEVLAGVLPDIDEPLICWLDAHGGMVHYLGSGEVFNPAGSGTQCPVTGELQALQKFDHLASSCILIDDARCFLGPLPQLRSTDWPELVDVIDLLRGDGDRYITILDDVIISVPSNLKPVVEEWWLMRLEQIRADRQQRSDWEQLRWQNYSNPKPSQAARLLVKSVTPGSVRTAYSKVAHRTR